MTVFEIKDEALEALSQIEKEHTVVISEELAEGATLSPFDLKSSSRTNMDLSSHRNLLNHSRLDQSEPFGGTGALAHMVTFQNALD